MGESTQGATHVTKLSIDISELQKNVSVAQSLIDNLANNAVAQAQKIQESLSTMASMASTDAMAGNPFAGIQQQFSNQATAINASLKSLKSLEGQYLNIQKAIQSTKSLQQGAFANVNKEVSSAIQVLKNYQTILERGGTLTKEQEKRYSELTLQVKTLSNEVETLNNESQKIQQGSTAQNPIEKSLRSTREEVEKTSKSYNDFILKLGKSPLSESYMPFKNLFTGVKDSEQQVEVLLQAIKKTGTATDEQKAKLISLTSQLKSFQTEYAKILKTATEKNVGFKSGIASTTIQEIQRLSTEYQRLQQTADKVRFNDTEFRNASATIRDNAKQLTNWIHTLQSTGNIPSDVANKVAGMREQITGLTEVVTRFSTTQKTIREFAKELQNAQKFLSEVRNQTTLAANFDPYKEIVAGAERYEQTLQRLLSAVNAQKGANQQQIEELNQTRLNLERLREGYSRVTEEANRTGKGLASGSFKIDTSSIEKAILAVQRFQQTVSGSGLKNEDAFKGLLLSAENAQRRLMQLSDAFKNGNVSATRTREVLQEVSQTMTGLQTSFSRFMTEQNKSSREFDKLKVAAKSAISELKNLEKSVTFGVRKQQIADLRREYENLYNSIKSGSISFSDAQNQLSALGNRYEELSRHVETAESVLQRFASRVIESVKWRVAQTVVTSLHNSFRELVTAVKDTEDTIIALQRVINDSTVSSVEMQSALHEIAYEYGRTFDEASETAIKFAQTGLNWTDTLEATKASMLGLNVTELSLSAATDGLIATMTQFGLEASELDDVINKVNITSDNFPVTAEKIVAALQRTGASAAAAGMSLEDTIAVITALSEATGRSGENLGTALNSIIAFTSKQDALETFASYLKVSVETLKDEKPIEVWKRLGDAIKVNEDAIGDMMAQSEEFAELFNADIANALNLQNEFNAAVANEQDVYSQAGTYRKTYFIALLNNIDTAIEALDTMRAAEGYSIAENEKTMESLSAKWNQLGTAMHQLAVAFGEAGFLDFLKFLTEAATDTVKLIGSLGGLKTVLLGIVAVFALVKREQLGQMFMEIANGVGIFIAELRAGTAISGAFSIAMGSVTLSLQGIVGVASLVALGVYAIGKSIQKTTEDAKKMREENIRLSQQAVTSARDLASAYTEYKNAVTSEERTNAVEGLLRVLGYEKEDISFLVKEYGELENGTHTLGQALDVLAEKKYEQLQLDSQLFNEENITPESLGVPAIEQVSIKLDKMTESEKKAADVLKDFGLALESFRGASVPWKELETKFTFPEKLKDAKEKLAQAQGALREMGKEMDSSAQKESTLTQGLKVYISALEQYVQALADGTNNQKEMSGSFEEFIQKFEDAANEADDYIDALDDAADANENFSLSLESIEKSIQRTQAAFDEVSGKIDSFQSAYGTIVDLIDEYNDKGYLTADMLQTLLGLEPEYLEMIDAKNGKLRLNKEAVDRLVEANDIYLLKLEALKIQEDAEKIAKQLQTAETLKLTEAELEQIGVTEFLTGSVALAAQAFLTGQDDGEKLREELRNLYKQMGLTAERVEYATNKMWNQVSAMKEMNRMSGLDYTTTVTTNYKSVYTTEYKTVGNPNPNGYVATSTLLRNSAGPTGNETSTYSASNTKYDAGPLDIDKAVSDAIEPVEDKVETLTATLVQYANDGVITSNNPDINRYYTPSKSSSSSSSKKSSTSSSTSSSTKSSTSSTKNTSSTSTKNTSSTKSSTSSSSNTSSSDSSSSSGKSPEEEAAEKAKKAYEELMDVYDHSQKLLIRNGAEAKEVVEIYQKEIEATQEQIEKFNDINVEERDKYIRDLEEKIWELEDSIYDALAGVHEAEVRAFENAMYLLEQKYQSALDRRDYSYMKESLQKQLDIQQEVMTAAHAEAQRLRELGVEENDEAIQECIKQYWNARQKVRDINKLIAGDIMDAYSDFMSFASSLNLWDHFDFTKVDYIRTQLEDINRLMREGYITADEYISLSKQWSVDYYNAAKEALEANMEVEKAAAESRYNETIARYEQEKEVFEREKERIKEYYDALKEGYQQEIDVWEKRKKSSDEYYDSLIANLQDVQKANDRINKQLDYYNNRSKIITNIEQAQARSGVEWRQKEIEYRQQLIELDENWNRTLTEWNIQDQISHLQELKEIAAKDIDETIAKIKEEIEQLEKASDAAVKDLEMRSEAIDELIEKTKEELEAELESIANQMDEISRRIAESIQATIQNGIVNSRQEMDAAILATQSTMLASNDIIQARVLESIGVSADEAMKIVDNKLLNPIQQKINSLSYGIFDPLISSAVTAGTGWTSMDSVNNSMLGSTTGTSNSIKDAVSGSSSSGGRKVVNENGMDWIIQPHEGPMGNGGTTNIFVSNEYSTAAEGARGTQEAVQWIIM